MWPIALCHLFMKTIFHQHRIKQQWRCHGPCKDYDKALFYSLLLENNLPLPFYSRHLTQHGDLNMDLICVPSEMFLPFSSPLYEKECATDNVPRSNRMASFPCVPSILLQLFLLRCIIDGTVGKRLRKQMNRFTFSSSWVCSFNLLDSSSCN